MRWGRGSPGTIDSVFLASFRIFVVKSYVNLCSPPQTRGIPEGMAGLRIPRSCQSIPVPKLLQLLRSSGGPRVSPGKKDTPRVCNPSQSAAMSYPDPCRWMRTPSGWTSVPKAYVPDNRQFPRLPYPEFPPILYHEGHCNHHFSQCGFPGCGREAVQYRSCPRLDYECQEESGRFFELDSSQRSCGASPACRTARVTEPTVPAVRYRTQRAQFCQTSRPPSIWPQRASESDASGANPPGFKEVLVDS